MQRLFAAVVTTVVPEAARLDAAGWTNLERIVEQALADRPASLRRGLKVFLRLIDWIAVVRYARRFSALDAARRARLLASIERAPLLLVRRGFWGLRTLVFMGYYGRPAAATEIGYRADPRAGRCAGERGGRASLRRGDHRLGCRGRDCRAGARAAGA